MRKHTLDPSATLDGSKSTLAYVLSAARINFPPQSKLVNIEGLCSEVLAQGMTAQRFVVNAKAVSNTLPYPTVDRAVSLGHF